MNVNRLLAVVMVVALGGAASRTFAAPLSTAFTFQGRLVAGGSPANGFFDLRLLLFTADTGGAQVGAPLTNLNVGVSNGLFTTLVDFGSAPFDGTTYWVDVGVRPSSTGTAFRPLAPRQRLTGTPYALFAAGSSQANSAPWAGLTGVPAGFADGTDDNTTYSAGDGLSLVGTEFRVNLAGSGSATTAARSDHTHAGSAIISGTIAEPFIAAAVARDNEVFSIVTTNDGSGSKLDADFLDGLDSTEFWKLEGNAGTSSRDFLGTTDNAPLELHVNNARVLRLEPDSTSPNILGGYRGNFVSASAIGATISGGGTANNGSGTARTNRVLANYGTVAGGFGHSVEAMGGTIGGGRDNTIKVGATNATIPGGWGAAAMNYGQHAYASGSFSASGDAQSSTYVLRVSTSNSVPVNMALDGVAEHMKVPVGGRWAFDVLVVASMPGTTTAAYQLRGAIRNVGGTTALLAGAPAMQSLGADPGAATWSVAAVADNALDALVIRAFGPSVGIVHWVASVRVVELTF